MTAKLHDPGEVGPCTLDYLGFPPMTASGCRQLSALDRRDGLDCGWRN
jgi:hypothetical protein